MPKKNPNPKVLSSSDARIEGQIQIEDVVVIDPSQTGSGLPVVVSADGNAIQVNGSEVPVLDEEGKLELGVLPYVGPGLINVFTVANEAAQLALEAQEGDVAVRTDLENAAFMHNGGEEGTLADWTQISFIHVTSVAGKTGDVSLETGDVDGLDTALSGKAEATHTHEVADITDFDPADKADTSHTHAIADVTGLQAALDAGGGGGVSLPIDINNVDYLYETINILYNALTDLSYTWFDTTSFGSANLGSWSQEAIYKLENGALEPIHSFSTSGKTVVDAGLVGTALELGYVVYYYEDPNPLFEIYFIENNGVDPSTETFVLSIDPATSIALDTVPFVPNLNNFATSLSPTGDYLYLAVWNDEIINPMFPSGGWERTYEVWQIDLAEGTTNQITSLTANHNMYDETPEEILNYRQVTNATSICTSDDGATVAYNFSDTLYLYDVASDTVSTALVLTSDIEDLSSCEYWAGDINGNCRRTISFAYESEGVSTFNVTVDNYDQSYRHHYLVNDNSEVSTFIGLIERDFLLDVDNMAYYLKIDQVVGGQVFLRYSSDFNYSAPFMLFLSQWETGSVAAQMNINELAANTEDATFSNPYDCLWITNHAL